MDFFYRDVYFERIRLLFFCLIFIAMLLYIVNNGNILTDDRNERRYLKRKYNELQFFKNTIYFSIIVTVLFIITLFTCPLWIFNFDVTVTPMF